tara:strand:- start:830 stop:973 length:144 start_codon:yes stop_codon:yes gene_type:complete
MNWRYKLMKWFDLNIGWFFVNGFKQEEWYEYIKDKYGKDEGSLHADA